MAWDNSTRRQRLPSDWPRRRRRVLRRDGHRCTALTEGGTRCPATTDLEVDHVVRGDDHRLVNLQTLCADHHQAKTIAERPQRPPRRRPTEQHPGLIG